jgi:DNA-binding FadR family transcriptional regulator
MSLTLLIVVSPPETVRLLAAAGMAVPAATAADRTALVTVRDTLRPCGEDPESYQHAHLALHQALLDASHDDVLALMVRSLVDIMDATTGPPQPPTGEVAAWIEERASVHVAVVDAVLDGDVVAAWKALTRHGLTPEDLDAGGLVSPPGATTLEEAWRRAVR